MWDGIAEAATVGFSNPFSKKKTKLDYTCKINRNS